MKENEFAPLELYISFDNLPAVQMAGIMMSLSSIYALLRDPDIPTRSFDPDGPYFYNRIGHLTPELDSELCLDFARTGNSIVLRFDGRRTLPQIKFNSLDDVEVVLPKKWGPTAVAAGVLVAGLEYSQHLWNGYLERELKNAEIQTEVWRREKIEAEVAFERARTEEILARIEELRRGRTPPVNRTAKTTRVIQKNINVFNNIIGSVNINTVSINGIEIKNSPSMVSDGPDSPSP